MWYLWFALFVWILFKPQSYKRSRDDKAVDDKAVDGFQNNLLDVSDLAKERYQRSIYDRDISKLSQYYENPKMSCPYKYEEAQDVLTKLHSDPKNQYYGFTGTNFKYDDDRHVIWEKLSQPLPVHADFFQS